MLVAYESLNRNREDSSTCSSMVTGYVCNVYYTGDMYYYTLGCNSKPKAYNNKKVIAYTYVASVITRDSISNRPCRETREFQSTERFRQSDNGHVPDGYNVTNGQCIEVFYDPLNPERSHYGDPVADEKRDSQFLAIALKIAVPCYIAFIGIFLFKRKLINLGCS